MSDLDDFGGERFGETTPPNDAAMARPARSESRRATLRFQFQPRTTSREGKAFLPPHASPRRPAQDATVDREAEVDPRPLGASETACVGWTEPDWLCERHQPVTGTKRRGRNPDSVQQGKASIQATPAPFPRSATRPTDQDDPSRGRLTTVILHETFHGRPPSKLCRSAGTRPKKGGKSPPHPAHHYLQPPRHSFCPGFADRFVNWSAA